MESYWHGPCLLPLQNLQGAPLAKGMTAQQNSVRSTKTQPTQPFQCSREGRIHEEGAALKASQGDSNEPVDYARVRTNGCRLGVLCICRS